MRAVIPALLCLLSILPARAVESGDRGQVQGTISRQIDLFRRDDAAGAYALAGPGIQSLFPTPDAFLGMVQRAYRPVYRPRSFDFGSLEDGPGGGLSQSVRIQDEDGVDWLAVYTLEKGADGAWRISGCSLVKAPGMAV